MGDYTVHPGTAALPFAGSSTGGAGVGVPSTSGAFGFGLGTGMGISMGPARPGVLLRGPERRSRLIQLPSTYQELIDKAASIFTIDSRTHEIHIVLADDEECEIGKESLGVIHDRERLLVKVEPRPEGQKKGEVPGSHTIALAPAPETAPSSPAPTPALLLPPPPIVTPARLPSSPPSRDVEPSLPIFKTSTSVKPPSAPIPARLELQADEGVEQHDDGALSSAAPSSQKCMSNKTRLPLPSAMKVKAQPSTAGTDPGVSSSAQTLALVSSTSATSSSLPPSTSPSTASKTASSAAVALAASIAPRKKRDVRRERKRHAERTIARERARMAAEAAALAAGVTGGPGADSSPSNSQGSSGGDTSTPSSSQTRRRISFAGVPDEESDGEGSKAGSQARTEAGNDVKVDGNSTGTHHSNGPSSQTAPAPYEQMWTQADGADEESSDDQESPSKRRKLNADAAVAARVLLKEKQPAKGREDEQVNKGQPSLSQAPTETTSASDEARDAPSARDPQVVAPTKDIMDTEMPPKPKLLRPADSTALGTAEAPFLIHDEDSEEEEIAGASPPRRFELDAREPTMPRGRPPTDPVRRAEYLKIKEECQDWRRLSPTKAGRRSSRSVSPIKRSLAAMEVSTPTHSQKRKQGASKEDAVQPVQQPTPSPQLFVAAATTATVMQESTPPPSPGRSDGDVVLDRQTSHRDNIVVILPSPPKKRSALMNGHVGISASSTLTAQGHKPTATSTLTPMLSERSTHGPDSNELKSAKATVASTRPPLGARSLSQSCFTTSLTTGSGAPKQAAVSSSQGPSSSPLAKEMTLQQRAMAVQNAARNGSVQSIRSALGLRMS